MTIKSNLHEQSEKDKETEKDPVEDVAKHAPVVVPVFGAVLIFMLAFIAVTMA